MAEKVVDGADAELSLDGFDAGDPEAGRFVVLLGLRFLVAFKLVFFVGQRALAIAVVGLVVDDDGVP